MSKNIFDDFDHLDRPEDVNTRDDNEDLSSLSPEFRLQTNQGLGHTKNPAKIMMDNFYFRQKYEGYVCRAFADKNIPSLPLVVMCTGMDRSRIETDSMIITEQQVACVELDGPCHNEELAIQREYRNRIFKKNNIPVIHYKVPDDWDMNWARAIADNAVDYLQTRRQAAYLSFYNGGIQL